jgi:hypothetical protein
MERKMANCTGRKKSIPCDSIVHSCGKCTNVGCDQLEVGECSNQGFLSGVCLSCGTIRLEGEFGPLLVTPQLREAARRLKLSLPDE